MLELIGLAAVLACLAVPAWVYAGYPALLLVLSRVRPRPVRGGGVAPPVTVIVPAHDEAAVIVAKVENAYAGEPSDSLLEVLVASDGSTDGTVEAARALLPLHATLRVLDLPRLGKAAALDAAAAEARGDILVLTDANAMLEPGSLAALLWPFGDPAVGGVAGRQRHRPASGGDRATGEGETAYWRFDTWLKSLESATGSCCASDGSLHALRRELYVPIADPAQADDMAISMRVVTAGRRLVLAERAVAWEDAPRDAGRELRRKVRVTNHSLRSLLLLGPALWRSGLYSVVLVSHKLLRHLTPLCLLAALGMSLGLAPVSTSARLLLLPQLAFYAAACLGRALRDTPLGRVRPLLLPWYFCLANAAALVGSLQVLLGRRIVAWRPDRGASAPR